MIPKRIFFYWGNNTMSWMRFMTLKSFRIFNPNFEMILYVTKNNEIQNKTWYDNNVQDFHYFKGINYYDKINDLDIKIKEWDITNNNIKPSTLKMGPSHKSNFLKWCKLYEEGGIYSDLDILYFKPIENFYESIKEFDTVICQTDYLSIGFMASTKNNLFFKDIFNISKL